MQTKTIKIVEQFRTNSDEENAIKMSAYMKYRFPFLGLPKPQRDELSKDFLRKVTKGKMIDWNLVNYLWELPEREFQYLALEYLGKLKKQLKKSEISKLEQLIVTKSWWDSVDSLAPLVGVLCKKYPELKTEVISNWIISSNIWLKRVSIIFQLKFKDDVDTELLSKAIIANTLTKEFFVNKAIGWALRQYSKFNPDWVKEFISTYPLSPLSVREGSKYL
ncbi:DNA alkylation repair protein [Marinifilum sp. D714]|uniref:DNA alkylation repair protein n=1 Tax=Marinifilum sp. D714 TaxID=2937523 RepID=UPI0027C28F81|nr:DNA alkylation repair protein [Marinifilum sp. D714]MDQ2179078.1 DNA alkylation repair protein [Marinifilum sp. D714]